MSTSVGVLHGIAVVLSRMEARGTAISSTYPQLGGVVQPTAAVYAATKFGASDL
jgi:hypothetical protein